MAELGIYPAAQYARRARYPVHRSAGCRPMNATAKVTAIRGAAIALASAADAFLSTHRVANANTHCAYASAIDRTIEAVGGRNRAAVSSWLTWCTTKKKWVAPSVPADAERRR